MRDRLDEKLFQMAAQEVIEVPDSLPDKIDRIMEELPAQKHVFHMNWRKALVLAAMLTMTLSITVTAAVSALQQRMEAMNHEKMEEYFTQIYESKLGNDNYNRPFTESEERRMQKLMIAYEEQALFPEGELRMLEAAEDYKGKGVAFYAGTSTFFFPEREMTDEEFLQLIDFRYKREYSLAKMNEMIETGEMQMPEIEQESACATDSEILQSEALYKPEQELIIPYTGDLEAHFMAAGQNCIFLTGYNEVHKMEIGRSESTLFFDDFGEQETRIVSLCQDKNGDVYMGVWKRYEGSQDTWEIAIWVVNQDGEFLREIELTPYTTDGSSGMLGQMVVDEEGYLYARFSGKKTSEQGKDSILLVFDKEGNLVNEIDSEEYDSSRLGGLCLGKDGKIYTQIQIWDGENRKLGIASVNREKGCLENIYLGIVPDGTIMLDIVAPGADTDFVFWGYDGIFTYNIGDESAVNVLPAYEAPCQWEGVMNCALPDGRIVFGDCGEYRKEELEDGTPRFYSIPEKICFYYMSSVGE